MVRALLQAHRLGLVDTLVQDPLDVPCEAEAEAQRWSAVGQ